MDFGAKRVAIGVAGAFFASVGFLLSVLALVLNPLIPTPPVKPPLPETQQRYITNSPFIHGKPNSARPDSSISSRLESDITLQTTSNTSLSSQDTSIDSSQLHSRPLSSGGAASDEQKYAYRHSAPPKQRSPVQRLAPLPIVPDHFTQEASSSGIHAPVVHELRAESRRIASAPAPLSIPPTSSPSPVPRPSTSPSLPLPTSASAPLPSNLTPVTTSPALPSCDSDVHCSMPQSPHSFRIPSLKRSWTGKKNKVSRSATCLEPTPNSTLTPAPGIPRPSSSSSIKSLCPKKREERSLRKSSSTPSPKLKSSRCRKGSINGETLDTSKPPPLPRARTQPYEAPYFFPSPASPDAGDYIRKAREDKTASRSFLRHSAHFPLTPKSGGDEKSRRTPTEPGMASVPPTQVHFAA